jgi:AraC-like DNA-binding protein
VTNDPLSDALALANARLVVSGGFAIGGTWALVAWPQARLKLTAVVRGTCWVLTDAPEPPLRLAEGDVAVLNDRRRVVLASDPTAADPVDPSDLFGPGRAPIVRLTDTEDVLVIGGHVDLNQAGEDLLLTALPPVTAVRSGTAPAPMLRWLLDRLQHELTSDEPGGELAVRQYSQLLLLEVLRAHLGNTDAFPAGWMRALADDRLAPALRLMHADPGRAWQLPELARAAAMSRTTFAERFRTVAGMPPLTYLHRWRMRLAERALREDDTPIATLAPSLGYTSESAFSNAFKRTVGVAPRRYRDAARQLNVQTRP